MKEIKFGLMENWKQFSLLVIINAFVGGMIGLERSILPQLAEKEFNISSKTAIFSFIIAFGITKAICNYYSGKLANKIGRKNGYVIEYCGFSNNSYILYVSLYLNFAFLFLKMISAKSIT